MDIDKPPRTVWHGFPDVLIHADESTVKGNVDYLAAKAGDVQAARRLVEADRQARLKIGAQVCLDLTPQPPETFFASA